MAYSKSFKKKTWAKPEKVIGVAPDAADYSLEQERINTTITTTNCNVLVRAAAGTGKTFTIRHALWKYHNLQPNTKSLYVVFNTKNRAEAETKMPLQTECLTLHAMGRQILTSAGYPKVIGEGDKVWRFLRAMVPDPSTGITGPEGEKLRKEHNRRKFFLKKLIDFSRIMLLDESVDDMRQCAIMNHINLEPQDFEVAKRVLDEMNKQFFGNKTGVIPTKVIDIDFIDMIYMPVRFQDKMKFDKVYDLVCLDEYQDTTRMAYEMIQRYVLSNPNCRFLAVGDKMQAIYGFSGAEIRFFGEMLQAPNTVELTLSTCYRCKPAIIREANKYVDYIHPWENFTEDGTVIEAGNFNNAIEGDFILCRKNRPIVKICLDMLKVGKRAVVRGKDIAEDILKMLESIDATTKEELLLGLFNYVEKYVASMVENRGWTEERARNSEEFKNLKDRSGCVEDMAGIMPVSQITDTINSIFSDDAKVNAVILSTVHRAKGLESDSVYILDLCQMETDELKYVAITRAQNKLVYCNYEGCEQIEFGGDE